MRREIGRGAAGVVYLATAPVGRFAAVKVCLREELGDVRYERELRGASERDRRVSSEDIVERHRGMTRDNLYQIRARFTAKLKTLVATIRTEMDEGRFCWL